MFYNVVVLVGVLVAVTAFLFVMYSVDMDPEPAWKTFVTDGGDTLRVKTLP